MIMISYHHCYHHEDLAATMSSLGELLTEQEISLMMGEAGADDGKVGNHDHHGGHYEDNNDDHEDYDPLYTAEV